MGPRDVHTRDLDDVQLLLQEGGCEENKDYGKLLEVAITYSLDTAPSGLTAGYVFRQPISDPDDQSQGRNHVQGMSGNDVNNCKKNGSSTSGGTERSIPAACSVYSTGGGVGTLRDLDSVRCWLPCLDSPDQRAIFDITLHYPSHMHVMTSGKKISTSLSTVPPSIKKLRGTRRGSRTGSAEPSKRDMAVCSNIIPHEHCFSTYTQRCGGQSASLKTGVIQREISSSRFFSVTRLPAMSIGFFIGQVRFGELKNKIKSYDAIFALTVFSSIDLVL